MLTTTKTYYYRTPLVKEMPHETGRTILIYTRTYKLFTRVEECSVVLVGCCSVVVLVLFLLHVLRLKKIQKKKRTKTECNNNNNKLKEIYRHQIYLMYLSIYLHTCINPFGLFSFMLIVEDDIFFAI